jgi:hypothetical protein
MTSLELHFIITNKLLLILLYPLTYFNNCVSYIGTQELIVNIKETNMD